MDSKVGRAWMDMLDLEQETLVERVHHLGTETMIIKTDRKIFKHKQKGSFVCKPSVDDKFLVYREKG